MKSKDYVTLEKGNRIEVSRPTRTGRPGYVWVQGWHLKYPHGRKSNDMRYGEAQWLLRQERAKPVEELAFTRILNDVNGNPRYVCHFLNLVTKEERDEDDAGPERVFRLAAIGYARGRQLGGRKFHNKQYGGGVVFQSYSLEETTRYISAATGRHFIPVRD